MKFKKLNEIAKVIAGQSPPSTTYNTKGEGMPFFQGKADFEDKYPKVRYWCTSKKKKEALPGDILMSVRAPVGPVNICDQKAVIGRGIAAIRPLKGTLGEYLFFFFRTNEQKIASLGTGSTFKAITQETLKNIQVPVPSEDHQIRIATLLSRVEALITRRKGSLRLLDKFLESTFLEMFGNPVQNDRKWDKKHFSVFSNSRLGKMRDKKHITGQHLRKYIGNSNVKWFQFDLKHLEEMDFDEKERNTFNLSYGDLLVCEGGEIGRCAIWKNNLEECYFQKAIHRVKLDLKVAKPEYVQYVLFFYSQYDGFKNVTSKATIAHLTGEKLKETQIPLPPIELQNKFVSIFDKTESLKVLYQKNLIILENLYGALSQKAFKGELDLTRIPLDQNFKPKSCTNELEHNVFPESSVGFLDHGAMSDPKTRERILRSILEDYLSGQPRSSFSFRDFWLRIEFNVLDHMDEESPPLGVEDYNQIKAWLFEHLKRGQVEQYFDEHENQIKLYSK